MQLSIDGQAVEVDVMQDSLTRSITGGGPGDASFGARFRDKGFSQGVLGRCALRERLAGSGRTTRPSRARVRTLQRSAAQARRAARPDSAADGDGRTRSKRGDARSAAARGLRRAGGSGGTRGAGGSVRPRRRGPKRGTRLAGADTPPDSPQGPYWSWPTGWWRRSIR